MAKSRNNNKNEAFENKLYLFKYFLSLFGLKSITDVEELNSISREGIDEETNQTNFYEYLKGIIEPNYKSKLKEYDDNIIEYLQHINRKREFKISLKYFQYLAILFTEFYLDYYFNNKNEFIDLINKWISNNFNNEDNINNGNNIYDNESLNKLAYMCATGSGKTLILHINILQMMKYNKNFKKYSNVLLLTKNERLSTQHKEELDMSDIKSEIFDGHTNDAIIQIIDINKIKDENGPNTFDYRSFEESNLLFVDEGHSGAGGDVWFKYRKNLVEINGFTFEYSATLKEAVSNDKNKNDLELEYQKAIIFDYQYLYFRNDGYGKDYQILNLDEAVDLDDNNLYLTGCLLTYFEQLKYFVKNEADIKDFLIEKPLMVFVGTTVSKASDNLTDVSKVVLFLENFVSNKKESIKNISKILKGKTGIIESNKAGVNRDLFENKFLFLKELYGCSDDIKEALSDIYKDILNFVFNYKLATDKPHIILTHIKSDDDEIGIKIGNSDKDFAVISVGDTDGLLKILKNNNLHVNDNIKSDKTLFSTISNKDSSINILIGSKKFIEGWNNYRVSTMGLINFAKNRGVEAIQLFGRGVRLKGYNNSLKRSESLDDTLRKEVKVLKDIKIVETLNIFGLSSNYMAEFKEFLNNNGLEKEEKVIKKVNVIKTFNNIKNKKLKVLKLKKGMNFNKDSSCFIFDIDNDIEFNNYITKDTNKIVKSYMNIADTYSSNDITYIGDKDYNEKLHLTDVNNEYIDNFIDYDNIYFELVNYKKIKKYNRVVIVKDNIKKLIENDNWYYIIIDKDKLKINNDEDLYRRKRIICDLLKSLLDKYYKYKIKQWESQNLEYCDLDDNDDNFINEYEISFENSKDAINNNVEDAVDKYINDIENIIGAIKNNIKYVPKGKEIGEPLKGVNNINDCFAILCPEHLYKPLYSLGDKQGYRFDIKPIALNKDEKKFVELLLKYRYSYNDDNNINYYNKFLEDYNKIIGANAEIYLLRNMPKKGIGFFEANNFYPDFILWMDTDTTQYINFIDPKGIEFIKNDNPKIRFCSNKTGDGFNTIKDLEMKLSSQLTNNDKKIKLNAFILSNTKKSNLSEIDAKIYNDYNIIYMYNDNDDNENGNLNCIDEIFKKMTE